MTHLKPETLGALHDGALGDAARRDAERHLAGCATCREALAALAATDGQLAAALRHDPGEAYFASFADRVATRIAAGDAAGAPAAPRRSVWAWLAAPRGLALAGGVAAVAIVSVLVLQQGREARAPLANATLETRAHSMAAPPPEATTAPSMPPEGAAAKPAPGTVGRAAGGAAAMRAPARDEAARAPQRDVAQSAPAPVAPQANATGIAPGAREDVPAGTGVTDRERAESAPPAAEPQALQKAFTPEAAVRALKSRAAGRLDGGTPPAPGFAAAPAAPPPPLARITRASSTVAWSAELAPMVRRADSLSTVAQREGGIGQHMVAGQYWVRIRELTDPGTDAERFTVGRIAEERYSAWRLRPVPTALAPTRAAIEDVLRLTPDGPQRVRWQRLLDQVK